MEELTVGLLLVCLLLTSVRGEATLELKLYDLTEDPLLACNDGSPGGFYYRPATSPQYESRWIFYLEGGGWCWNATSCEERIQYNGNSISHQHLVSSSNWASSKTYGEGIFQMTGSGWEHAHLVFLAYCSSDAHMGDMEMTTGKFGVQQYRGRRMARQAVSSLVGKDRKDQKIIFGGTSAGGRGSMVLVDHLHELLDDSTMIYGLHDSGAYQDISPYDSSYYPFGSQCQDAFNIYQPPISTDCSSVYSESGDLWKCVCGEYMLPHVLTPSQVIIYLYDSYQLSQELGLPPLLWNNEMCRYTEDQFVPGMRNTVKELELSERHLAWGAACYRHGILTSSKWNSIEVSGLTAQAQLLQWLEGGNRTSVVSSCAGVNCQDTCPPVLTGQNSYC